MDGASLGRDTSGQAEDMQVVLWRDLVGGVPARDLSATARLTADRKTEAPVFDLA